VSKTTLPNHLSPDPRCWCVPPVGAVGVAVFVVVASSSSSFLVVVVAGPPLRGGVVPTRVLPLIEKSPNGSPHCAGIADPGVFVQPRRGHNVHLYSWRWVNRPRWGYTRHQRVLTHHQFVEIKGNSLDRRYHHKRIY